MMDERSPSAVRNLNNDAVVVQAKVIREQLCIGLLVFKHKCKQSFIGSSTDVYWKNLYGKKRLDRSGCTMKIVLKVTGKIKRKSFGLIVIQFQSTVLNLMCKKMCMIGENSNGLK